MKISKYLSVKYYQINKEKLQKKLLNNIKDFRRKKKLKKQKYGHKRQKNIPEGDKRKLVEYRKIIIK